MQQKQKRKTLAINYNCQYAEFLQAIMRTGLKIQLFMEIATAVQCEILFEASKQKKH